MTRPETERYYTSKLGLLAPSIDDELTALRQNWNRLDSVYSGGLVISPGVTPDESILFDGCIVAEKTTGIIWRAQRNASGVFEKRYIKYPWRMEAYQPTMTVGNGSAGVWIPWGYASVGNNSVNASSADMVNNRIVIPVTGIYVGTDWLKWHTGSSSGARALTLSINDESVGVTEADKNECVMCPNNVVNSVTVCQVNFARKFNKGDRVCGAFWQNSGGNADNEHMMTMTLIKAFG